MRYRVVNLGETINHGIEEELIDKESKNFNFNAGLMCMALKNIISREEAQNLKDMVEEPISCEKRQKKVKEYLKDCLAKNTGINDWEDILRHLDEIAVRTYMLNPILWEAFPNVYIIKRKVYYIVKVEDKPFFRVIGIDDIDRMLDFSKDFLEDIESDYTKNGYCISSRYSDIIDYDEDKNTLILKGSHAREFYAEFDVETEQQIIHHNYCYGTIKHTPIIKKGPFICAQKEDGVAIILSNNKSKNYTVKDHSYLLVEPELYGTVSFRPFKIYMDHTKEPIEIELVHTRLWNLILRDVYGLTFVDMHFIYDIKDKDMAENFCIKNMKNHLGQRFITAESKKKANQYLTILDILSAHGVTEESDLLDYFIMIGETSQRLKTASDMSYHLLNDTCYETFKTLHETGDLPETFADLNEIQNCLCKHNTDSLDNVSSLKLKEYIIRGKIGCFRFGNTEDTENDIETEVVDKEKGICIGSQLVYPNINMPGIVSYNIESGSYDIQYPTKLNRKQEYLVKDEFNLLLNHTTKTVEEREANILIENVKVKSERKE